MTILWRNRRTLRHYALVLAGGGLCILIAYTGLAGSLLPLFLFLLLSALIVELPASVLALILALASSTVFLLHRHPPLSDLLIAQTLLWFAGIGTMQIILVWRLRRQVAAATKRAENLLPFTSAPGPTHLYARLVDLAADAIVVTDSAGYIVVFNQHAEQMFGYTRDEALGQFIELLVPAAVRDQHIALRLAYMDAPHSVPLGAIPEQTGQRKDGSTFPCEIALAPVAVQSNGHAHTLVKASVRDITQRKAQEEQLMDARVQRQAAEDAIAVRDQWIATLGHELRTPLTAIGGFCERLTTMLLRAPNPLPPAQRTHIEHSFSFLAAQTARLSLLVDQLLDFTRLQGDRLILQQEDADIVRLARDQIILIGGIEPGHDIMLDAPEEPLLASVDVVRIGQVLANLLSNACKYAPDGMIIVRLRRTDAQVRISVIDRGPGIAPERQATLFERFSPPQPHMGMGIGLWLSARIVALHDGTIAAEFPPEGGTTVTVTLPLRARAGV